MFTCKEKEYEMIAKAEKHALDVQALKNDREKFKLEIELAKINSKLYEQNEIKNLNDRISVLESDLKIERAKSAQITAEQKSSYAEHVMAITDERVKEIKAIYEGYAKNLTDVVKASHTGATHVTNTIKS